MSNWKKYDNGNYHVKINLDNGTKIRYTEDDYFKASHAENMDIKICDYCDIGCKWCHEGSTKSGKFGDILNEKFIDSLHPWQELAIGGGDATAHPDLIPFLERLKEKNVIANLTVNQIHFIQKQHMIGQLVDQKLIHGVGVSLMAPTTELIELVQQFPNAVIHTINGMLDQKDIDALAGKDLKVLILGYKHLRRGNDFYDTATRQIEKNQNWLKENVKDFTKFFKVVSFDNLAITQLEVKNLMSPEAWEKFYMGDDGTATFYIDMANRKFSLSSTAPLNERFELLDSVDDMFAKILSLGDK